MNLADLLIVAVLVVSVVSAFVKGFFVEVFSLAGVFFGLFLAAADYGRLAPWVLRLVQNHEVANLIAFLLIVLLLMVLAGLAGRLLRGLVRRVGLGIVDRLLGAFVGLLEGCVVVTLVLMAIVAFLPRQEWLQSSRLAPAFLTAAHGGSHVVPFDLGEKIRQGLQVLRMTQPGWLQPSSAIPFGSCHAAVVAHGQAVLAWCGKNTNLAVERVGRKGKERGFCET